MPTENSKGVNEENSEGVNCDKTLMALVSIFLIPLFIAFVGFGFYFVIAFAMWLTTDPLDLIQDPVTDILWLGVGGGFGCGDADCVDKYKIYD